MSKLIVSLLIIITCIKHIHASGCQINGTELICKEITLIEGNDINIDDVHNVSTIKFANSTIALIPLGTFARFKDATFLDVSRSKIQTIEPGAFNGVSNLHSLNLERNGISEIKSGTVNTLSNLKWLDLSYNRLTKIDKTSFSNMTNLTWLDLDNNLIEILSGDALEGLVSLQGIRLDYNRLKYLPTGCLKDLVALKYLYLRKNLLTDLEFGILTAFNNITESFINKSELAVTSKTRFLPLQQLDTLYINDNKIIYLNPYSLASVLPKLREIYLNNNAWSCNSVSDMLSTLTKQGILVRDNGTITESNVFGIACKSDVLTTEKSMINDKITNQGGQNLTTGIISTDKCLTGNIATNCTDLNNFNQGKQNSTIGMLSTNNMTGNVVTNITNLLNRIELSIRTSLDLEKAQNLDTKVYYKGSPPAINIYNLIFPPYSNFQNESNKNHKGMVDFNMFPSDYDESGPTIAT